MAATLAVGCAALAPLVLKPEDHEKDILLPLLALGLRKEYSEPYRVYAIPVHSTVWGIMAGRQCQVSHSNQFLSDHVGTFLQNLIYA